MDNNLSASESYQKLVDNIHHYSGMGFILLLAKQVGIVDSLLKAEKALTAQEIANRKNLKERYTREILASLACARLVKVSARGENNKLNVYHLDQSAKDVLMRVDNLPNISALAFFMGNYEKLKQCVPLKGPKGYPYSKEFTEFVDEWSVYCDDRDMTFVLDKVPEIRKRLDAGIRVLEIGSGPGTLTAKLAKQFPKSTFTASEMNEDMVQCLRKSLGHLPNVRFGVYDLCDLPERIPEKFEWVILKNTAHVIPHPARSLKEIRRFVSEPDGVFTCLDFFGQGNAAKSIGDMGEAIKYGYSLFNCVPMSLHQANNSEAYGCCWNKDTGIRMIQEAGFEVDAYPTFARQVWLVAKPTAMPNNKIHILEKK